MVRDSSLGAGGGVVLESRVLKGLHDFSYHGPGVGRVVSG